MAPAEMRADGRRFLLLASTLLAAAGCGAADAGSRVVRDSAGVRIIEISDPANVAAERWDVSPDPVIEIGPGSGAPGELYQVVSAFRMRDGRVVVANAGTSELRIFDGQGRHLRTIGGSGDGPGRFQRLFWAGRLRGDSIGAWDAALARLSVFDPEGTFVRTVTPRLRLGFYPRVVAVLEDGSLVLTGGMDPASSMPAAGGIRRDSTPYLAIAPDGSLADTLGLFQEREHFVMRTPGGGFVVHPVPYGNETVAAGAGTSLLVGSTDRYALTWHTPRSGVGRMIRAERARRPITDRDVRRYREELVTLGGEGDADVRRQQARLLDEMPVPDRMPAFTALRVDSDGLVWLRDPPADRAGPGATWHVLDEDGERIGEVTVPAPLQVHEIARDGLLGVFVDDRGVEHVRLHRLTR